MLQGPRETIRRSRTLRKEMSYPEFLLWNVLRLRPEGLIFRKQHPAGLFTLDFFCHKAGLVVEVDGMAHDMGDNPARDTKRDVWCAEHGLTVLRIPAREVLSNLSGVAEGIVAQAQELIAAKDGPPVIPPFQGEVAPERGRRGITGSGDVTRLGVSSGAGAPLRHAARDTSPLRGGI